MGFTSFEQMPVWQKAMEIAVIIFKLTDTLPRIEDYGLTSQSRRSALSVPGNIAEGFGRKHTKDKLNFYYDSRGSLSETKNHLIYGYRVGSFDKVSHDQLIQLISETREELNMVIRSLENKVTETGPKPRPEPL